jgi:hypothetical protein
VANAREDHLTEVEELTGFLRDDARWNQQRDIVRKAGLDPTRILLISFQESEDLDEWGTILTEDGRVLEWKRNTNTPSQSDATWTDLSKDQEALRDLRTLAVARELMGRNDS